MNFENSDVLEFLMDHNLLYQGGRNKTAKSIAYKALQTEPHYFQFLEQATKLPITPPFYERI
jgi:hypothetical protein